MLVDKAYFIFNCCPIDLIIFVNLGIFGSLSEKNLSSNKPNEIEHYLVKLENLAFNKALEIRLNLYDALIFLGLQFDNSGGIFRHFRSYIYGALVLALGPRPIL